MIIYGGRRPRRSSSSGTPVRHRPNMGGGIETGVGALIVGASTRLPPGELVRRGMAGLDDIGDATAVIDSLTGGRLTEITTQLDRAEFWLKASTAAGLIAAAVSLIVAFGKD